jgi:hypothetical protein
MIPDVGEGLQGVCVVSQPTVHDRIPDERSLKSLLIASHAPEKLAKIFRVWPCREDRRRNPERAEARRRQPKDLTVKMSGKKWCREGELNPHEG